MSEQKHSTIAVTKEEKGNKRSLVTYVYGQIYRGYLETDSTNFVIKNIHVREWKRILGWMKKEKYIVDFSLGDDFDTACELTIKGFNDKDLIYKKYIQAVKRNFLEESKA